MRAALLAGAVAGCGELASAPPSGEPDPVSVTTAAVTNEDICHAAGTGILDLDALDLGGGAVLSTDVDCDNLSGSNLSYLGSVSTSAFNGSAARLEAQTMYCALKSADQALANATEATPLGTFGMTSQLNMYRTDPVNLRVSGQRYGTVYAFGVGLQIENHTFDWKFDRERQPQQSAQARIPQPFPLPPQIVSITLPDHTGQYASESNSTPNWTISARGTIPAGPGVITLGLDYFSRYKFAAANTRSYVMRATGATEAARRTSWTTYVDACNTCRATGGIACDCPTSEDTAQSRRLCPGGCNETFWEAVADGRLPHEWRRGVSGTIFDKNEPYYGDYWHFGLPGAGARALSQHPSNEPSYDLANGTQSGSGRGDRDATSGLNMAVGYKFDVGVAELKLRVEMDTNFRDGVALRTYRRLGDVETDPRFTDVGLDAQAAFDVTGRLILIVDIPFFGNTVVLDESIEVIRRRSKQSSLQRPSVLSWSENRATGAGTMGSYFEKGVAKTLSSCLAIPPVTRPPLEAQSPPEFVNRVRNIIPQRLFPCNVRICTKNSPGSTATTLRTCNWNAQTASLACFVSGTGCTCADNSADLCDAFGNVYSAVPARPGCSPPIE